MPEELQLPPVIGRLSASDAAEKLRELGETELASRLDLPDQFVPPKQSSFQKRTGWTWPFGDKPWQHTSHAFGYIAGSPPSVEPQRILQAGSIAPDLSLKHSRLKITLNRLRVASYPGGGTHRVLLDFYGQNQVHGGTENVHFNATYRVREGQHAGVIGFPIFLGLHVGSEGVAFRCFTINVKNDNDEALLSFLESDTFRAGLKLIATAQPAIEPLSRMTLALTRSIASRTRNVAVQDFYMGLDFSNNPLGARLAEGAFVAVQIPQTLDSTWNWDDWVYSPTSGQIVKRADMDSALPFNYIVFGVSRYEET